MGEWHLIFETIRQHISQTDLFFLRQIALLFFLTEFLDTARGV